MPLRMGIDVGSDSVKGVLVEEGGAIVELPVLQIQGQPLARVRELLADAVARGVHRVLIGVAGRTSGGLCELLQVEQIDEISALAAAFGAMDPDVRVVIEMGRESQKYLRLRRDAATGRMLVEESSLGHKCAAGTGSFLDHMHRRLNYPSLEEFARTALETDSPATLSGRCGVFTESDIVHLYQKGTPRERIAAGIHQAICRTYRCSVVKGRPLDGKVALIGGVSRNPGVQKYLAQELSLDGLLIVPEHNVTAVAIGAALCGQRELDLREALRILDGHLSRPLEYRATSPLRLSKSVIHPPTRSEVCPTHVARAGLGVDIGSVSTKAALVTLVDGKLVVIASYYRRTEGDPLSAVRDTIAQIHRQLLERGVQVDTVVAGTTGSGRYLTADYIGADVVKNEITAQAHGTMAFAPDVDTIFEIGGQDSKYVRLSDGVVVDFEMNKACAAGTGAFLEKQAQNLGVPISEFGELALQSTAPPELDWQCTVFSESAMLYYQRNNIPREDLAAAVCLASARNYLNKNVANRSVGDRVAFQGAVAFSRGMVAALETVLGRPIVVPPYPHLTGAAGVAWLALKEGPERPSFAGFDRIATATYEVSSFECKGCANRCDVNTFRIEGGERFYYNDRCEKFSAERKQRRGEHLPDLFAEYEQLLMRTSAPSAPPGAPRVAIPRGLLFHDYFPLWNTFLRHLGMEVLVSPPTAKDIIARGIEVTAAEPCFPVKVAHGHVAALLDERPDYLFLPRVHDAEQPSSSFKHSTTCPYVQSAPEVISAALGLADGPAKLLTPSFWMSRGERHVRRVLREVGAAIGKPRREVDRAIDAGLEALREFRASVERRGCEVLSSMPEDQMAFVVIARPYALYDSAVNMHVGQRIRDLGIMAIPQDFLPLANEDPSDHWVNAYARQIQKKLAAARIVRRDPRMKAIVVTYFGCGPDSFANLFVKEELGEPCYVMQIDEHTADAGVITRIEAFADTATWSAPSAGAPAIRTGTVPMSEFARTGKVVWIPSVVGSSRVLVAALRAWGVDAREAPRSPDPGLNLARRAVSEDVCLPALINIEDMLYRTTQPDFEPAREAFFQGHATGPCRFGMYHMLQRRILDHAGLHETEMVTLGAGTGHGGLGRGIVLATYDAELVNDMLQKMLHHTRAYEVRAGESDAIYWKYVERLCELLPLYRRRSESRSGWISMLLGHHLGEYEALLAEAQEEFARVERRDEERPLVGLVGEFYVRLQPDANLDVIRKLEHAGAEVWLAPLTEFFGYYNYVTGLLAEDRLRDLPSWGTLREALSRRLLTRIGIVDEHHLFRATRPYMDGFADIAPPGLVAKGSRYLTPQFGGEAICSMGKADDFADIGLDGIVSVSPFNCMPGMTVSALSHELRRRHGGIPFLCLDYDGFEDAERDAKIRSFVRQAVDARHARAGSGRPMAQAPLY